jgi:3-phosphoshikimate 1-carboxyvinyltransferase
MNKTISKSLIHGVLNAPTSKSALQRLIVAAFLSDGKSLIEFESMCEDARAVLGIAESLVKSVKIIDKKIEIIGGIQNINETVNVGESGLGLRMIAPVLSAITGTFEIAGKGSLLNRPVGFVVDTLQSCGVKASDTNGSLPLIIEGPITSNNVYIDGSIGSQLLTGFLVAAPLLKKDFEIIVNNLKSRSYIDLTISILHKFGIEVSNDNYERFSIKGGQSYKACNSYAEGDWSGAAFVLVAAAIAGELKLTGIDYYSLQGDKQIVDVLKQSGADVKIGNNEVIVKKDKLMAFQFDATDVPDLFPPLVALAVNCKGKSKIKGVSRLKHKESDRASTLQEEFSKLGARIILEGDNMIVEGTELHGANVFSNHDHRIAMALAVAGLTINSKTIISGSESVGKSWPDFFEKMHTIGANIE